MGTNATGSKRSNASGYHAFAISGFSGRHDVLFKTTWPHGVSRAKQEEKCLVERSIRRKDGNIPTRERAWR